MMKSVHLPATSLNITAVIEISIIIAQDILTLLDLIIILCYLLLSLSQVSNLGKAPGDTESLIS